MTTSWNDSVKRVGTDYFVLPISEVERSLTLINASQTENGRAFARLRLYDISADSAQGLRATLAQDLGQSRQIDSIVVRGYDKFPRSFLKYYAGIRKGTILIEPNSSIKINPSIPWDLSPPPKPPKHCSGRTNLRLSVSGKTKQQSL